MPTRAARTLKALYRQATGDATTHQRTIDAHFRKIDPRRQRIVKARLAGESLYTIAAREHVTHGTVASALKRTIERIRKAIAHEPRFNVIGHPGGGRKKTGRGTRPQEE